MYGNERDAPSFDDLDDLGVFNSNHRTIATSNGMLGRVVLHIDVVRDATGGACAKNMARFSESCAIK